MPRPPIHGLTNTPEHACWRQIKSRCSNQNASNYIFYGGKGIIVTPRWTGKNGFLLFFEDMGRRPSKKHSIDRIDHKGNYTPENCRWATSTEQIRNRCCTRFVTMDGIRQPLAEWAKNQSMSYHTAANLFVRKPEFFESVS